jgi:glycosyltransferase involved in cell wall biosynthesis
MTPPLVSISLQTYNRAASGYLRTALDAILAQTYTDFELLVIDNHSTDETARLVLSYKDARLTYVRLPPGGTPADSIRAAFRMSRGRYLLTTHDDDVMEPRMLERQMACVAAHPDLLCLATNVSLIDTRGLRQQQRLYEMEDIRYFYPGEYIKSYFEEKLWFPTPTLLFRRDAVVSRRRGFTEKTGATYFPSGDIAGLFRLNVRGDVAILAEPLLRYRQHGGQESRNVDQSAPLVALADYAGKLLRARRENRQLLSLLPLVAAFTVRYQSQDSLFRMSGVALARRLRALKRRWEKAVPPERRGMDVVLPFEVLMAEMGYGMTIPATAMEGLCIIPPRGGSQAAYRQWVRMLQCGRSLFFDAPGLRRIAIMGSMFTAYLIVLAAQRCGVEVICCLDSSPARVGHEVFGVPVVDIARFDECAVGIDAVVLSSERDHEESLRRVLREQTKAYLNVLSWKSLVAAP